MMKALICAGGTGGGIYPALAVATALQSMGVPRQALLWIGVKGEMEEKLVPRTGIHLETIRGGPIVTVPPQVRVMNAVKLTWSIGTVWQMIGRFRPDVALLTGGYMAAPVALAAWLRGVPIAIYLPDVEPGAALKAIMPLAQKVACTSANSRAYVPEAKMVVTGYPVRPELRAAAALSQAEALAQFDLSPGRRTLFVFGGSRGAQAINRALMAALPTLLAQIQVIHISGELTWPEVEANAAQLTEEERAYYRPYPYLHERMGAAFRAADLVLARAGASMMGEGPAFGLPAVLVPLAWAWRYQKVNADFLTQQGAAVQLTDESLPAQLVPTVLELLQNPARLAQMGAAARALDAPDAATNVAQLLARLAKGAAHD